MKTVANYHKFYEAKLVHINTSAIVRKIYQHSRCGVPLDSPVNLQS